MKTSERAGPNRPAKRALAGLLKLSEEGGAQLVEFALALPLLLVLLVGIADFGTAFNTKHIMTNAAREAARMVVSNSTTDFNCNNAPPPCPIQGAADAVKVYMVNGGLSTASCIDPTSGTGSDPWTFSCSGVTLIINRNLIISGATGGDLTGTQVTLTYPYTWTLGNIINFFNSIYHGGSTPTFSLTITTTVVMQNLVSGT